MNSRYEEACELIELYKLDEAFNILKDLLEEDGSNYLVLNKLGAIYARQKNYEEARNSFNSALSINPDYAPAIVNLGNLELEEGKNQEAIDYYNKAIEKDSEYHLAYYNMAVAYKRMGKLEDYFKLYKRYKRKYREYMRNQNMAEATKHRSKALQISTALILFVVLIIILK
jgi:tetratricopeptide (TPR) repeat protein